LIAGREIRERLRGRVLRIGTLVILAVVAAAIVIPVLEGSSRSTTRIGIVGKLSYPSLDAIASSARSLDERVALVDHLTSAVALRELRAGRLDIVIVNSQRIDIEEATSSTATDTDVIAASLAQDLGRLAEMNAAGLTPAQIARLSTSGSLPIANLRHSTGRGAAYGTTLIGLILTFIMLSQYNTWILIGVMEEKSSRVVEVLLAAVRPIRLLAGKVLGIGTVALLQATVIVVFALVVAKSVGSGLIHGSAPLIVASTILWLVLGYIFYCWVYAAAGSMVERQDQVQSIAFPLSMPIIFGYIVGLTSVSSSAPSAFVKVLAYLPPTAPFEMPVLVSFGAVTWWQFCASILISLVATLGVARAAAVVYRRSILRTGRRVTIRSVLRGTD
jgi:ABC-2 type transport system permease protein